ncbi:YceD family protein [Novispirillum sp. DQ9]|uniref:YceD family protein n=1 Tax=Novispirillum sp. DQ9 TaxID=3398612 RepID=UPI003C7CCE5B
MTESPVEFSRPLPAERLPNEGRHMRLEADEGERAALAKRFDLVALDDLHAEVRAKPFAAGELVRLSGSLNARVTQTCGITLAPVVSDVTGEFDMTFSFAAQEPEGLEIELDAEGEDPPEPIVDGVIDVGEVVAEQLALLIDPFPRAPGAEFTPPAEDDGVALGPFAALAALRKGK